MKRVPASKPEPARAERNKGGRPPKFREPSRPITVTLPLRTLQLIETIDTDRAHALTKAVDAVTQGAGRTKPQVSVVEISKGVGLIVVGPSKYLRRIGWLRLAEIAPARYILSVPSGTTVDSIEIAIVDQLDAVPAAEPHEHSLLQALLEIIRTIRRAHRVTKGEILFVSTAR
jgi:hypothetical protein